MLGTYLADSALQPHEGSSETVTSLVDGADMTTDIETVVLADL